MDKLLISGEIYSELTSGQSVELVVESVGEKAMLVNVTQSDKAIKTAWSDLKRLVDRAVNEGIICGFNKDDGSNEKENAMYKVYERIQDTMERLEKEAY